MSAHTTMSTTRRKPRAARCSRPPRWRSMFRVDPKTVTRWAKAGKLSAIRTLGGHRRYSEAEVRMLLGGVPRQRDTDI